LITPFFPTHELETTLKAIRVQITNFVDNALPLQSGM
jgi:hypothetical protein